MNSTLSFKERLTCLALPSRASAFATSASNLFSSAVISFSSDPKNISVSLAPLSRGCPSKPEECIGVDGTEGVEFEMLSAIRTRMQCVGLLSKFQRKAR